jgi:hypothetical protein
VTPASPTIPPDISKETRSATGQAFAVSLARQG